MNYINLAWTAQESVTNLQNATYLVYTGYNWVFEIPPRYTKEI